MGTLDAVQVLAGVSQLLPKSRENYLNRCMDQERLRRESTSQKEMDKVGPQAQVPSHRGPSQVRGMCQGAPGLPDGSMKTYHRALVIEPSVIITPWVPQGVYLLGGGPLGEEMACVSPPILCLVGRDENKEGGREPEALGGEVQLSPH